MLTDYLSGSLSTFLIQERLSPLRSDSRYQASCELVDEFPDERDDIFDVQTRNEWSMDQRTESAIVHSKNRGR